MPSRQRSRLQGLPSWQSSSVWQGVPVGQPLLSATPGRHGQASSQSSTPSPSASWPHGVTWQLEQGWQMGRGQPAFSGGPGSQGQRSAQSSVPSPSASWPQVAVPSGHTHGEHGGGGGGGQPAFSGGPGAQARGSVQSSSPSASA